MDRTNLGKILVALILALCAIISVAILGHSFRHRNDRPQTVYVKGGASRNFVSDLVVWDLTISDHSQTPLDGLQSVERQRETVKLFLAENGISADEVEAGAVSYYELEDGYYDSKEERYVRVKNGFNVEQTITVTSNNVDLVEKVARQVGDLIERNVAVRSYSPRYYYTKLADLKLEMLAEASSDALARAEHIAHQSGGKIDKLKSSSMGVFQILGKYSDENYSWGGTLNTSSKEKTVSITISSTFLLK